MLVASGFFTRAAFADIGFRWLHILAGITWIGLLYYFNLVQVPSFAQFEQHDGGARARNIAIDKLARKALWWFRWAALATFLTGIAITVVEKDYFAKDELGVSFGQKAGGVAISTGILLGTIMMLNVWGVIWRNQKVVLANAVNVLNGGAADPNSAGAGRKALMASRQNMIFSVPMLFFMVYMGHADALSTSGDKLGSGKLAAYWIITLVIIVVLELNALGLLPWKAQPNKGINAIYDGKGVRNPLIAAFGLWLVFFVMTQVLLKA